MSAEPGAELYLVPVFSDDEAAAFVAAVAGSAHWVAGGINADLAVDRTVREADVLFEQAEPAAFLRARDALFAATRELATRLVPHAVLAELQLVRYRSGGHYVEHRDSPMTGGTPRVLSIVCYLNDDFRGGATVFAEPAAVVTPVAGMALVFAPQLLHRAEPVAAGTKYAITAWYHTPPGLTPT